MLLRQILLTGGTLCTAFQPLRLLKPRADIANGTVIGSIDLINGIENFFGIPYAIPPTGTRRLTNPSPLSTRFGTFAATGTPTACLGYLASSPTPTGIASTLNSLTSPLLTTALSTGEDCLNLNVQRPLGATSASKLPVLVYIYGGGFNVGSTGQYDGTPMIRKAISLGKPLLYVAMSYRLAALGFLPGKEMQGLANLGLKDQRLALKWIQDNIAAFGGDPSRVTIWGESAGSISCFDHLVIDGGNFNYKGRPLFQGAILNSGTFVPALDIAHPVNQAIYDKFAQNAGCGTAADSLACLRSISSKTFQEAQSAMPGLFDYQFHLSFQPRPDASDAFLPRSPDELLRDNFARVPIIVGDQEDEGTLFSMVQSNLSTTNDLIDYWTNYFPITSRNDLTTLVTSYPDDPAAGSPYRTGNNYNQYPQYKRLAAMIGDLLFDLTRRTALQVITQRGVTAWSYLNTYLHNGPPLGTVLGTCHGSDILNNRNVPLSATAQNATQTYYISFVYFQDPNAITPSVKWPKWDLTARQLLNFTANTIDIGADYYREEQWQTQLELADVLKT